MTVYVVQLLLRVAPYKRTETSREKNSQLEHFFNTGNFYNQSMVQALD